MPQYRVRRKQPCHIRRHPTQDPPPAQPTLQPLSPTHSASLPRSSVAFWPTASCSPVHSLTCIPLTSHHPDKLTGRRQNDEAGAGTAQTTVLSRSLLVTVDGAENETLTRQLPDAIGRRDPCVSCCSSSVKGQGSAATFCPIEGPDAAFKPSLIPPVFSDYFSHGAGESSVNPSPVGTYPPSLK